MGPLESFLKRLDESVCTGGAFAGVARLSTHPGIMLAEAISLDGSHGGRREAGR